MTKGRGSSFAKERKKFEIGSGWVRHEPQTGAEVDDVDDKRYGENHSLIFIKLMAKSRLFPPRTQK